MSGNNIISIIAVLKAKPGNVEHALFQPHDAPDTFYVHESWHDRAGLDAHIALPHFQAFVARMDELLAEPLRLDYLVPVEG